MRNMMRTLVMAAAMIMMGVGAVHAQLIDGSTGQMVDASTDPADFMAVASGQPGNIGTEIAANAAASFQAEMAASNQADANAASAAADANSNAQADDTPYVPAIPATPKPAMTPNGGSFQGSVQIAITDKDAAAKIFYTVNGKKPTESSAIYAGPIPVSAKTKVQAMAWDVNDRASGVVSKTFKQKG